MSETLRLKQPPAVLPLELEAFLAVERARKPIAVEAPTASAATVEPEHEAPGEAASPSASPPSPAEAPAMPVVSRRRIELREIEKLLRDLCPKAFVKPARPLAIGVYNDLLDLLAGEVAPIAVRRFVGAWCRRDCYLRGLVHNGERVGLDGEPAGTITPEQQARPARRLLEERGADL